ncbi:hypothetical protein FH972_025207 [Carpinus fangiana]|uniref:C2 domain-containing protein n=1 Tax=Carpinus fangiana TaxID=176857 RepID=A0A5N6L0P3_9ROSI|nr:hypothetical protein FH972_025207 [Carpinus fangiana]
MAEGFSSSGNKRNYNGAHGSKDDIDGALYDPARAARELMDPPVRADAEMLKSRRIAAPRSRRGASGLSSRDSSIDRQLGNPFAQVTPPPQTNGSAFTAFGQQSSTPVFGSNASQSFPPANNAFASSQQTSQPFTFGAPSQTSSSFPPAPNASSQQPSFGNSTTNGFGTSNPSANLFASIVESPSEQSVPRPADKSNVPALPAATPSQASNMFAASAAKSTASAKPVQTETPNPFANISKGPSPAPFLKNSSKQASPPKRALEPDSSSTASMPSLKMPKFSASAGGNAFAAFASQAEKSKEDAEKEAEKKELEKRFDADYDSDEEDERTFNKRVLAEIRAERAKAKKEKSASASQATFDPVKGFSFSSAGSTSEKAGESQETPPSSAEAAPATPKPAPSLFSPAPSTAVGGTSIFATAVKPSASGLGQPASTFTPAPATAVGGRSIFETAVKPQSTSGNLFGHLATPPQQSEDDDSSGDEHQSTAPSLADSTMPGGGKSLFERISKDSASEQTSSEEPSDKEPGMNGATPKANPFASSTLFGKPTPIAAGASDHTWKNDSPIKFGGIADSATPTKVNGSADSTTPVSKSFTNIFGAAKPNSTPNLFAQSASKPGVGFSFGASANGNGTPTSQSPSSTREGSAITTADEAGTAKSGESINLDGAPAETQLSLSDLTEEERRSNDVLFEVGNARVQQYDNLTKGWDRRGNGPLRVLKHKETGVVQVLGRSDPQVPGSGGWRQDYNHTGHRERGRGGERAGKSDEGQQARVRTTKERGGLGAADLASPVDCPWTALRSAREGVVALSSSHAPGMVLVGESPLASPLPSASRLLPHSPPTRKSGLWSCCMYGGGKKSGIQPGVCKGFQVQQTRLKHSAAFMGSVKCRQQYWDAVPQRGGAKKAQLSIMQSKRDVDSMVPAFSQSSRTAPEHVPLPTRASQHDVQAAMSTSSTQSRPLNRRIDSLQRPDQSSRKPSLAGKNHVSTYDAYTFALRVAYLSHLLAPKTRKQHVSRPSVQQRSKSSSTSTADLVRDFSTNASRDSKSTRFPRGFMAELDKRITGVLIGKEKMPEYADPTVKRTFAIFLNEFKKPEFRKSMENDRRVEDLLLIFFSNATKELQKGKAQEDLSWRLLVDRHVALFVRLISATIKSNDWQRDRPELSQRLQTLERKLLMHDQDLTSHGTNPSAGNVLEIEEPKSQLVKDMPLVVAVAQIFSKSESQVQGDIDAQKDLWTAKAALQDLKMYQANLSLNTKKTLRSDDFDTEAAYEAWKKAELPDLSQMMLAIVQSNLELARDSSGGLPQFKPPQKSSTDSSLADPTRLTDESSTYAFDQPVDMSALDLNGDERQDDSDDGMTYVYIPSDVRTYYRSVLKEALRYDRQNSFDPTSGEPSSEMLLSKRSTELLNELGLRWRVPFSSRLMLFLDVVREGFIDQELDVDTLDAALRYVKEPIFNKKKLDPAVLHDRTKWTISDFILNQQVLNSIHDALLRDLFEQLSHCYDTKPPEIGGIMEILETHIYDDPVFSRTTDDLDRFAEHLKTALHERALEHYHAMSDKEVGAHEAIDFFHVIQLGKSTLKLCEKTQKRYRKTPTIMGVEPFTVLVETVLPTYAKDARDLTAHILEESAKTGEELPVQDGFDLYKELVQVRQIHAQALPEVEFAFHIEGLLASFVWRWIAATDTNMIPWVEGAVRHDTFGVRTVDAMAIPTDEQRHSSSVIDIFRSFNEAIDQITKLEWNDDYQYAKFMTAMSKATSGGIEKYCEMLEQYFTAEMDRLTPAQEAELAQTRQEKWMKMAKNAISTQEKVEPFQFLPESFVKLNDIEQAMQLLDKLQIDVNMDTCADVIRRHEPESQKKTSVKRQKNVFTIKIIEAEDLRACDANGLSDPYVVLGDEFQKRLAKTRIIYSNLNPRWDETVDIKTTGLLNVTATIWDHDILGDHDCVGRTTIKLDPNHFGDFLPREYWLDLDTQGRLLVRVSMEGEKDDIQFYFGKAFRNLKRTERDMTRKITDKLSAYMHYCLSRRALRSLSRQNITISSVSSYFNRNLGRATNQPTNAHVVGHGCRDGAGVERSARYGRGATCAAAVGQAEFTSSADTNRTGRCVQVARHAL